MNVSYYRNPDGRWVEFCARTRFVAVTPPKLAMALTRAFVNDTILMVLGSNLDICDCDEVKMNEDPMIERVCK